MENQFCQKFIDIDLNLGVPTYLHAVNGSLTFLFLVPWYLGLALLTDE